MNAAPSVMVGVDVGGTFTDVIGVDPATGTFHTAKVPTTVDDQSRGFLDGLGQLPDEPSAIAALVHGTTVGTNAVLERKGARCGLITTRGFRDVLELARRTRPQLWGLSGSFEPLIERQLRLEVTERVDARGRVVTPLNEDDVVRAVRTLIDAGAEALVIHFLHSHVHPAHEQRAYEIARDLWPNEYISVGSQILREVREFERGTTATLNAYLQPPISRYVGRLSRELKGAGFTRDLLIMQSNGGIMAAGIAGANAVQTLLSGPAAGAIAAAQTSLQAGFANAIACDMGGTSFDVCLIKDGQPTITTEKDIDYSVPIRVPIIGIHTIGAGGGSIAEINRAGVLQVGPESAGAKPGPICFARGGERVTITDANLLLGRINPDTMTGVDRSADMARVEAALAEQVGRHLGLDAIAAAEAVIRVANNNMASAIRLVSVEQGHDPRDFVLFAYGGAGPLHAAALARELGIPRVLVPRFPGITSALGCVLADIRHDYVRHVNRTLDDVTPESIETICREHCAEGDAIIADEGVTVDEVVHEHSLDLLYAGQTHVFNVPLPAGGFDRERVRADFHARYRERFDIDFPTMTAKLVNVRTTSIGRRPGLDLAMLAARAGEDAPGPTTRRVHFDGAWHDTAIWRRESLAPGQEIAGPAIVEQSDTTTVIEPGARCAVDRFANLVITVK